ncbi:MAG: TIGR00303 family protein [Epsilonproteobacteria bacterium]|nr:TIGR00303 family protein [Campylobacterota bacterium]
MQFIGEGDFLECVKGAKATFLLAGSVTQTCEIEGITQAGIPGIIHLTPTLDAEFVDSGKLFSLESLAETPKGVPTPAIITRGVKVLSGFSFETIDLGLRVKPQVNRLHNLAIKESKSIATGAKIDAKSIIEKGVAFAQAYIHPHKLLILGESTPSGTTTAYAVGKTLGYQCDGYFSSSFLHVPTSLKVQVVEKAVAFAKGDVYSRLGSVADNMLLFCAGFVSAYSKTGKIILGGGTQMAAVLLIIDALGLEIESQNIALMTTKWVYEDTHSDIKGLLAQLSFEVDGYYSDFSFKDATIPILKLYDKGEAKEGVGAGAALCYAKMLGFSDEEILGEIEKVLIS